MTATDTSDVERLSARAVDLTSRYNAATREYNDLVSRSETLTAGQSTRLGDVERAMDKLEGELRTCGVRRRRDS